MARNNRRREKNRDRAQDSSPNGDLMPDAEGAPDPIAHATPDAELAEAQMALGRPEFANVPDEDELEQFEEEQAGREPAAGALSTSGRGGGRARRVAGDGGEHPGSQLERRREPMLGRLTGFLRGSWTELQRVQWPDRAQVFQATGVVLGFVIVAGAFLALADLVASHLVNLIIK